VVVEAAPVELEEDVPAVEVRLAEAPESAGFWKSAAGGVRELVPQLLSRIAATARLAPTDIRPNVTWRFIPQANLLAPSFVRKSSHRVAYPSRMSRPPTRLIVAAAVVVVVVIAAIVLLTRSSKTAPQPTSSSARTGGSSPVPSPRPESAGTLALAKGHYPVAPGSQQTSPSVSPQSGSTTASFMLRLTSRQQLGAHGHVRLDYKVVLTGPRPRCATYTLLTTAARGAAASVKLNPPIELGWCRGTIHGVVLLETNPYCPPPPAAGTAQKCHLFATRLRDVGHFQFVTS
jgi:hypothetical protein